MSKQKTAAAEKDDPARMTEAEVAGFEAKDREAWEASAHMIIECGDVLSLFAREIGSELAGEIPNAKLLYLIGTSRLFDKTMHAAIKGTSSGGKSLLRQQVLRFFPEEEVVSFTTLSEKALLYYKDDFAHKILSMGEAAGADEQTLQDYLLRELISEGRLHYPVVQKVEGQGLVTVTIEKNGPVAFMVTTTKNSLHPENETRLLSLEINDTEAQTRAVLKKVAQVEGLNKGRADRNYDAWHDFQRWLAAGERRVVVPFADDLAVKIPAASVRLRRDFGQIIRAIKTHALLHRKQRQTDEAGQIVADLYRDYATVRELMNGIVAASSGMAARPGLEQTLEAVRTASAKKPADEEGANAQAIAKILKIDKAAAWRRLKGATQDGFVKNLETRRGQPGKYLLTGQEVEAADLLPVPEGLKPDQPVNRNVNRQVIETLSGCPTGCRVDAVDGSPDLDDFEERAAILEFDAGLSRKEAETTAADELKIPQFLRRVAERRGEA